MEWFEKVKEFITGFPQLLQTSPRYGYLIVAAILLLWLLGIICGWKWTYTRPAAGAEISGWKHSDQRLSVSGWG